MRWIREPGRRLVIALLTAMAVAAVLGSGTPYTSAMGFWGTLYPEYCFSAPPAQMEEAKPHFTFRWLHAPDFGDKIGEKQQSESLNEIR